jgi:hypothetical protein
MKMMMTLTPASWAIWFINPIPNNAMLFTDQEASQQKKIY